MVVVIQHALSLPIFMLLLQDMGTQIRIMNESEPVFGIPRLWLLMLANCITQYVRLLPCFSTCMCVCVCGWVCVSICLSPALTWTTLGGACVCRQIHLCAGCVPVIDGNVAADAHRGAERAQVCEPGADGVLVWSPHVGDSLAGCSVGVCGHIALLAPAVPTLPDAHNEEEARRPLPVIGRLWTGPSAECSRFEACCFPTPPHPQRRRSAVTVGSLSVFCCTCAF